MIPSYGRDAIDLRAFSSAFGSDEIIVIALHAEHLFSPGMLRRLDDLTRRALVLPHVSSVLSPTNARDLDGDEMGPFTTVPYEKVVSGETTPQDLGRALASHPLFGGLLVADTDDSGVPATAAILITLRAEADTPDFRRDLVARVRALAGLAGHGLEAHVAGLPVEKVDVAAYVARDQMVFAPLIFAMLGVVTFVLYRHPAGVIVPMSVALASVVWSLGLYAMAGRALNPVTSLITPVILVVSVAGAIHLTNHHLAGRAEGLDPANALARACDRSRVPCFNAAFTTAAGLASLVFLPIPAIRDFGLFSAAGVMLSYLLTMVAAPLLLWMLPDSPSRLASVFQQRRVELALRSTVAGVCRRPVVASVGALVVLGCCVLGVSRIRVETDLVGSLRESSPLRRATTFIDERLTGVNSLEIVISGVEATDPAGMQAAASFEKEVRSLPGIRHLTGLPDLYARANRAFHGGDDAFQRLPEGIAAAEDLADFLQLLRREAPEQISRFVTGDGRVLRLAARVTALDSGSSQRLFEQVRESASRCGLHDVVLTGSFVVLSNMSTTLVRNQVRGLVPALAVILAAMVVQFRSLKLGLLSAIPNGAPVLMVYGVMGWAGIPLSVPTAMIASIAVGMTVDNTIHLMARFRQEFSRRAGYEAALEAMLDSSGRAVVFSTITVALGFFVAAFSSFQPSVHFALLMGAALLLGLACELVLLPLTLVLFKPLGRPGAPRSSSAATALILVLMAAVATTVPRAAGDLLPPAREITLKDQFGNQDGPSRHRGATVLLLYGKATGLRRMRSWELKILEQAASGLQVVRALDARAARGRKTEAQVNERLRRDVPPEVSILVDWNGQLSARYALPDEEITVTILDPKGDACGTEAGPVSDEALGRVLAGIVKIRERGTCGLTGR